MTPGQVPIAATASTVISSKALAGAGAEIVTGPNTSVSNDLACFTGTLGQLADCSLAKGNVVLSVSPGAGIAHFNGLRVRQSPAVLVSLTAEISRETFLWRTSIPGRERRLLHSGAAMEHGERWQRLRHGPLTNPADEPFSHDGGQYLDVQHDYRGNAILLLEEHDRGGSGDSQGSPVIATCGRAFTTIDVEDCMTFSELPGNGANAAITFTIGHTGASTGVVTTSVPGPLQTTSDGVHPSEIFFVGNTTNPSVSANTAGILGPPTATFTGYRLQLPSTAPVGTQTLGCANSFQWSLDLHVH